MFLIKYACECDYCCRLCSAEAQLLQQWFTRLEKHHRLTFLRIALLMQVDLALNIMDGASLRDDPKQVMRVQRAKFEQKGEEYVAKKKPKSKKKAAGVLTKQEKELGWGGFDDKLPANKVCTTFEVVCAPAEVDDKLLADKVRAAVQPASV